MTRAGELNATYFKDIAEAEFFGRLNTSSGAWRTWDAFDLPADKSSEKRVLVASHDKSKLAQAAGMAGRQPRRRIIPEES
jgi:hypothetical protein